MTRKDYELIAKAVKQAGERTTGIAGVVQVAAELANALQTDNPRFDRERFIKACGC